MLKIYIDFKSPAAYLALKPTRALLAKKQPPTQWLPFRVRTRETPKRGTDETVAAAHRRVRAESRRRIFLHYAEVQGVEMRFPKTRLGTDLALGVLAEIEGDRLPFIDTCFAAYWTAETNLDDENTLAELVKKSGVAHDGDFARARKTLAAALAEAEEAGVVDTPAYLLGGQQFVGREHLPWVAEILDEGT